MERITVKPNGKERVYNCDTKRYITGETEVSKTVSVIRSLKKGELELVKKAKPATKSVKPAKKEDKK